MHHTTRNRTMRMVSAVALTVSAAWTWTSAAHAAYPEKTIRIVVPFAPGGSTDTMARMMADGLSQRLGQSVIVENIPGANGTIGATRVAASAPDGYTLMLGTPGPMIVNQYVYDNLSYHPKTAFTHIMTIAEMPNVLMVRPTLDVASVTDLVAKLKTPDHRLTHGSPGIGASGHVSTELFKALADVQAVHVPYNGNIPMLTDLVGGITDFTIDQLPPALPLIQTGKLRALAVTSPQRSPALPDVPTMAQAGFPGYEVTVWFALAAPAGMPESVVRTLNAAANEALKDPDMIKRISTYAAVPVGGSPQQLTARIEREEETITKVMQRVNLKAK